MVIYKSVPVVISMKMSHVRKIDGRLYGGFCMDHGDIPVATYNEITQRFEAVDNSRGYGYAHRNAKRYRNKRLK